MYKGKRHSVLVLVCTIIVVPADTYTIFNVSNESKMITAMVSKHQPNFIYVLKQENGKYIFSLAGNKHDGVFILTKMILDGIGKLGGRNKG